MERSDPGGSLCELQRAEANRLHALVRRAALAVHRTLGGGLSESVYQNALCIELQVLGGGTTVVREETRPIKYRGVVVGTHRHDIVFGKCIIETKSQKSGVYQARLYENQLDRYARFEGDDECLVLVVFMISDIKTLLIT